MKNILFILLLLVLVSCTSPIGVGLDVDDEAVLHVGYSIYCPVCGLEYQSMTRGIPVEYFCENGHRWVIE